jgi:hypothetical protein
MCEGSKDVMTVFIYFMSNKISQQALPPRIACSIKDIIGIQATDGYLLMQSTYPWYCVAKDELHHVSLWSTQLSQSHIGWQNCRALIIGRKWRSMGLAPVPNSWDDTHGRNIRNGESDKNWVNKDVVAGSVRSKLVFNNVLESIWHTHKEDKEDRG